MRPKMVQIGLYAVILASSVAMWLLKGQWWFQAILVAVILGLFHFGSQISVNWKRPFITFVSLVVIVFSGSILNTMRLNVANPPLWDYTSFWLNGRLAAQRLDFYEPKNYLQEANLINLSPTEYFKTEIIDVAFWYPPPSILLFLPLGWFSLQLGLVVWYGFSILVLIGVIYLLWSLFMHSDGLVGLLVTSAMTLMLSGTLQTFQLAQTGFLVLLMVLLFWREQNPLRAGVFLALAILVKPLAAVFLLYPLIKRQGRLIASTVGTLGILSLVVIVIFGLNTFLSYNPIARMPSIVYVESLNQSLLASILRLTQYDFATRSPITQPIFVIAALILVCVTALVVYRLPDTARPWLIGLLATLALLVYPATLSHYSVMLLPVFFLLWQQRIHFLSGTWGVVIFITLLYGATSYNNGYTSIVAFILCWVALIIMMVFKPKNLITDKVQEAYTLTNS